MEAIISAGRQRWEVTCCATMNASRDKNLYERFSIKKGFSVKFKSVLRRADSELAILYSFLGLIKLILHPHTKDVVVECRHLFFH